MRKPWLETSVLEVSAFAASMLEFSVFAGSMLEASMVAVSALEAALSGWRWLRSVSSQFGRS
jgi:hypothetical protein